MSSSDERYIGSSLVRFDMGLYEGTRGFSVQEAEKIRESLMDVCELLWHHCLMDESENIVKSRLNPVDNKRLDCFIVNADLVNDIYRNLKNVIQHKPENQSLEEISWKDDYPQGFNHG